jgi:AsmA protein
MHAFNVDPPATADPSVLRHAAFRTRFSGGTTSLGLDDFAMELDDSLVSGNLDVRNFDRPDVRFRFLVDELDVDRYLEPAPETAGDEEDVVLPQEELKSQEVHGELKIASLKMAGMAFRDADLGIAISNGKLRLHPLTAGFYGGRYSGDVGLDVSGDVPVVSLNESIEAISFQRMIADLVDSEALSGTAQGHVRLSGRGRDSGEVLQSLQGELGLSLAEGAVEGINIWYQIRRGMALYKGLPAPEPEPARTVFSRLNIDGSVDNGVVTTRELVGELPFLALRGSGRIDLGQSQVDLSLVAQVRNSPELARDPLGSGLGGKSLPFRITGALDAPSLKVDWEGLLKSEAAGVLLNKLGLGPKKDAEAADGEESAKSVEPDDSTESTEGDEEQSSGDQLKETAKGALFELLRKKTQDSEAEEEKDDGQQESGGT